jgi:hypothetical protein
VRTKLGFALTFLGVFLIVVAILAGTYAKSSLKKTPSDADSLTNLSGNAILNGPDGFEQFPVLAFSTTKADSDKSDGDVVLFQYSSCVVRDEGGIDGCVSNDDPEGRLLTASTDTFAADRKTALAVNDDKYLPAGATPHEGLLNKWPFDAQKKTYPYWDGTINQAVPAEFSRVSSIDGTEVYVYSVEIDKAPIQITDEVDGLYSDSEEISIEPRTGAFVNVERKVLQTTEDGTPVLSLKLAYTDEEVQDSLDEAVDSANKLNLLTSTVPMIGYIGGGLCLLAGLVLLFARRQREGGHVVVKGAPADDDAKVKV